MENYKNVSQDIRDQLNVEAKKAIERLKHGESINVQDLETNLYWEFGKFKSWDGESLESYYSRSQPAATRNRGKSIVNFPPPSYDQEPTTVADDDEMSKEKRVVNVAEAKENVEQADWKDETDDEPDDQELEAHYIKNRNKFLESSNKASVDKLKNEIENFKTKNKSLESSNNHFKEANNKLSKTNQLMFKDLKEFQVELDWYHDVHYVSKVAIDYMKNELFAHQETISIMSQEKEAQTKFLKTRDDKELEKIIALENKINFLDDIVYKTGQSVQTMNMLNRNCKTSFVKPEFLKKAQRANPCLYKWKPKPPIANVNTNVSMPLGNASRTANILKPMTPRCSTRLLIYHFPKLQRVLMMMDSNLQVMMERSSTVNAAGTNEDNQLPFDLNKPASEDVNTFNFSSDDEDDGTMADMNNLDTTIQFSHVPTTRIHKDDPLDQVIKDL
uniref:Uncharacterized protein n=1 Tax=Tanacetum cinerariifolium TaxID=118510 RepID=A0A699GGA7_TANCI|nr:hypothetical protein [Tanacetum cinerariifolium]